MPLREATRARALRVARLCVHHRVANFRSANDALNEALIGYHANLDLGEETVVFVACDDEGTVVGYIAITDLRALGPDGSLGALYMFVSAIAVDAESTNRFIASRLSKKVIAVARDRLNRQGRAYTGLMAIDIGGLGSFLARAGFVPLDGNPPFLWRPL